jgi:hypothetical protein
MKNLIIHSGTHKTASSYIQLRIRDNILNFSKNKIYVNKNNKLDKRLCSNFKNLNYWEKKLNLQSSNILLSSEHFSKRLVNKEHLSDFINLLKKYKFNKLKIIIFIRDQPDYINSLYCHSIRRFYHNNDFNYYVKSHLDLLSFEFYEDHLNYLYFYRNLMNNSFIDLIFIPFKRNSPNDPFIQLVNCLDVKDVNWVDSKLDNHNVQIGKKGIWLSRQIMNKIQTNKNVNSIKKNIRSISLQNKWHEDRYWGFDQNLYNILLEKYIENNNLFARKFWGCSWKDIFPPKTNLVPNEYKCLETDCEYLKMNNFIKSLTAGQKKVD